MSPSSRKLSPLPVSKSHQRSRGLHKHKQRPAEMLPANFNPETKPGEGCATSDTWAPNGSLLRYHSVATEHNGAIHG